MDGFCLLKKVVDPSVLSYGFTIPMAFQEVFYKQLGFTLSHGETRLIKLLCDGNEYEVNLKNIGFDQNKFNHTELLQVRYSEKSPIAAHFREVFSSTVDQVNRHYASYGYTLVFCFLRLFFQLYGNSLVLISYRNRNTLSMKHQSRITLVQYMIIKRFPWTTFSR